MCVHATDIFPSTSRLAYLGRGVEDIGMPAVHRIAALAAPAVVHHRDGIKRMDRRSSTHLHGSITSDQPNPRHPSACSLGRTQAPASTPPGRPVLTHAAIAMYASPQPPPPPSTPRGEIRPALSCPALPVGGLRDVSLLPSSPPSTKKEERKNPASRFGNPNSTFPPPSYTRSYYAGGRHVRGGDAGPIPVPAPSTASVDYGGVQVS